MALVEQGTTHTDAARRLCVSIKFVNDILDNLSSHNRPTAARALRAIGAWFLFLPPHSPDLNPIEINRGLSRTHGVRPLIFAKLKTLLRKAAARTYDQLWPAVGKFCDLFTVEECYNFFKAAGHRTD